MLRTRIRKGDGFTRSRGDAEELEEFQEGFGGEANVFHDFAQKIWRNISTSVKRNGGHAAVSVPKCL
jgi:hypothetical protein